MFEKAKRPEPTDSLGELREDLHKIRQSGEPQARAYQKLFIEDKAANAVAEQEAAAKISELLYSQVYQNPEAASYELAMQLAREHLKVPLTEAVAQKFSMALEKYRLKHNTVQKFIGEHLDPAVMFEKCFGHEPVGKIEVIAGPMTICFRCFDDDDYFATYTYDLAAKDRDSINQAMTAAKKTAGTAYPDVKVPELAGCVITERVGSNFKRLPGPLTKRHEQVPSWGTNSWHQFDYPKGEEAEDILLQIPDGDEWKIRLGRDRNGDIFRVKLINILKGKPVKEISLDLSSGIQRHKIVLPPKAGLRPEWVNLEFRPKQFGVFNHTKDQIDLETMQALSPELVIKDQQLSKDIRIHEEQHQFNKLFNPDNFNLEQGDTFHLPYLEFRRVAIEAKKHPEALTQLVAKHLAQIFRRDYMDSKARDEILAYTREGRNAAAIFETLSKSSTYNYKKNEVMLPDKTKMSLEDWLKIHITLLTRRLVEEGDIQFNLGQFVHRAATGIRKPWTKEDETIALEEVNKILNEDYEAKLERWTNLVKNMRSAGYKNQEIVAFLGILPISRWHSSVRRLLKSKGLRPIDKFKAKAAAA